MNNTRESLLREHEVLKEGYIQLLNNRDTMLEWGKPQLEALYATKIGALQLEHLKLQLSVKGVKRKIELVYQCINKDEQPDFIAIELIIAQELAEVEEDIMIQTSTISKAKILLTNLSSPDRSAALRKIFRKMAKQLRPDVNPNLTDEQLAVWYKIKDAYDTGDLERLKALEVVYEKEISKKPEVEISDDEMALQNATIKEGIRLLEEEIVELKQQFPFNIQEKINDEEWVAEQQETIKNEIAKLKEYEQELMAQYKSLMQEYGGS